MPYVAPDDANNRLIDFIKDIKARNGSPPWRERVLATECFRMVLLYWPPGFHHSNHYHPRADETWIICEGQVKAVFDGKKEVIAGPNSILFAEKGVAHDMTAVGDEPLLMIAFMSSNEPDDEVQL